MEDQNMSKHTVDHYKLEYEQKGTILIPFDDEINPLSKDEFEQLLNSCENVEKEFIEIGDAGEKNNLMVGRFMTDKSKPEIVENNYSNNVLNILKKKKINRLIKEITGINEHIYLRRVQYNQINEGNFVGYHLDTDSNPDYIAACVIQLGDNFGGGLYRVYQNQKKYNDFVPSKGSLIISNCHYPHEVTKVTKGERKSLVFFISSHFGDNRRYE